MTFDEGIFINFFFLGYRVNLDTHWNLNVSNLSLVLINVKL